MLVVTVVVIGKWVFGRRVPTTQSDEKVKALVAARSYEAAADRAAELGDLGSAYELYLRANNLQKAASVAKRLGKKNVAAELLETSRVAGDPPPKPASIPPLPPPTPKSQSIRPEIPSMPPTSAPNSRHTADDLRAMIAGRAADLSNIEVYYRLGVALQLSEAWDDAMRSFATVEEVSPGYRDAQARLEQIVRATGGTPSLPPSQQTDMPPPMRAQQRTMMGVAPSVVLGPSPPRELSPTPPPLETKTKPSA